MAQFFFLIIGSLVLTIAAYKSYGLAGVLRVITALCMLAPVPVVLHTSIEYLMPVSVELAFTTVIMSFAYSIFCLVYATRKIVPKDGL